MGGSIPQTDIPCHARQIVDTFDVLTGFPRGTIEKEVLCWFRGSYLVGDLNPNSSGHSGHWVGPLQNLSTPPKPPTASVGNSCSGKVIC